MDVFTCMYLCRCSVYYSDREHVCASVTVRDFLEVYKLREDTLSRWIKWQSVHYYSFPTLSFTIFLPPFFLHLSSLYPPYLFFLAHHDNRSPGVLYGGMFSNHEDHAERTTHDQRDAREWVSVCTGMGEWRMEYHICVWGGGGGGGGGKYGPTNHLEQLDYN